MDLYDELSQAVRVFAENDLDYANGTEIRVVSKEGLAAMKRLAGRDQDLLDLKKLGFEHEGTEKQNEFRG